MPKARTCVEGYSKLDQRRGVPANEVQRMLATIVRLRDTRGIEPQDSRIGKKLMMRLMVPHATQPEPGEV